MQAKYGHCATKRHSRESSTCRNGPHVLFLKRNALVEQSCIPLYIKRCELAFWRINDTLPDYLNASLRKNSDAHSRTTRNHCNLNLLRPLHKNISMGTRTFAVRTVKDWNSLPRSLKANKSLKSFKAELWKTLLNSQKTKGSFDITSWQYIDVFARFSLLNRSVSLLNLGKFFCFLFYCK